MTNKEILEKAIQKAVDGGWRPLSRYKKTDWFVWTHLAVTFGALDGTKEVTWSRNDVIFDHDFAKALWGEGSLYENTGKYGFEEHYDAACGAEFDWEVHMQRMVIAEDTIKYLGDNI